MKTLLISVIAIIVIVVGGFFVWKAFTQNQGTPITTAADVVNVADIPDSTTTDNTDIPDDTAAPSAPIVVTDSNASSTASRLSVSGSVTPNGADTTYWYEYGTSDSLGQKTAAQDLGSGNEALLAPAMIKGLTPSTVYYFRLDASNASGSAQGSIEQFSTIAKSSDSGGSGNGGGNGGNGGGDKDNGAVPTIVTAGAVQLTKNTATLTGTVTPNHSKTRYWFEFGTKPTMGNVTHIRGLKLQTNGIGVSADLSKLQPHTTYYFRLNANNEYGTTLGTVLTFTTP